MIVLSLYSIFSVVLQMSLSASLLILIAFAIRLSLEKWIPFRALYVLSGLILAVLILPIVPSSEVSLLGSLPDSDLDAANAASELPVSTLLMNVGIPTGLLGSELTLFELGAGIWAIGVGTILGSFGIRYLRVAIWVKKQPIATDSELLCLVDGCRFQMGLHRKIAVHLVDGMQTPAVFGVLSPRILLPERLLLELDSEELKHVILHELCHIRRRDTLTGVIASVVGAFHWFNPLVGVVFRQFAADREVLCDRAVINSFGPNTENNRAYGETLVHLVSLLSIGPKPGTGVVPFLTDGSEIKKRVLMIAKTNHTRWYGGLAGVAVVAGFAFAGLTLAAPANSSGHSLDRDEGYLHERGMEDREYGEERHH
ncbi:M56 family metallopeptidase [Verrucomicrobia bacterium]|jgi:beta-lactamase regulating signal transducer with metallopeptidase domain|nr:M56 family metallopeptidase [Verrucomicrobiota bacterium]